jgi:two-component system osmolarity sensor histidine kinase EnvZ
MLAGISHDLRTPLTRMKLMMAMVENSQDKQDILSDIDEMEKMLNGYLSFVRGEGDEAAVAVDVCLLVKDIVDKFSHNKGKIKLKLIDEKIEIVAKEQALKRAVTNIVANADRYGKKIQISVEASDFKVKIIVDDNGPGIPKEKREDVFRAFYRLENSRNKETGGIGLGLAITKDIINAHGGKISLQDGPQGGLRVVIELPR